MAAGVAGLAGVAGVAAGDSPAKAAPKPDINKIRTVINLLPIRPSGT